MKHVLEDISFGAHGVGLTQKLMIDAGINWELDNVSTILRLRLQNSLHLDLVTVETYTFDSVDHCKNDEGQLEDIPHQRDLLSSHIVNRSDAMTVSECGNPFPLNRKQIVFLQEMISEILYSNAVERD